MVLHLSYGRGTYKKHKTLIMKTLIMVVPQQFHNCST